MSTAAMVPIERLAADPLVLVRYRATDAAAVWDAIQESRATLQAWVPELGSLPTADAVRTGLAGLERAWEQRRKFVYAVVRRADESFVGEAGLYTLDWARRAATMGFWLRDEAHGRGYGTRALRALTDHALGPLGLQALDARVQPTNVRSRRLLERIGFQIRGTSPAMPTSEGGGAEVLVYRLTATERTRVA